QIMRAQGFENEDLARAVEIITADRVRWIETMLREEHGIALSSPSAWKAAVSTFAAFVVVGLIPLLPFLSQAVVGGALPQPFLWTTLMTAVAFFAVGAMKAQFVDQHWTWSGLETLLVGGTAASLAYLCGLLLQSAA